MGKDIHVRLIQFNRKTNEYELVKLYRKINNEFRAIPVYEGRDYSLFDQLEDDAFPSRAIYTPNLPEELRQELNECEEETGYFGFREINLADLKLYYNNTKRIKFSFIDTINNYINLYNTEPWLYSSSDVRILYWFDN